MLFVMLFLWLNKDTLLKLRWTGKFFLPLSPPFNSTEKKIWHLLSSCSQDHICQHWIATCDKINEDGTIEKCDIGNVRLWPKPNGVAKLGRLGVLSSARGLYIGQQLVKAFIDYCKNNGFHTIVLHSQYPRKGFYEKLGFVVEEGDDEIFEEGGTPHVRMWMRNL